MILPKKVFKTSINLCFTYLEFSRYYVVFPGCFVQRDLDVFCKFDPSGPKDNK